MEFTVECSEDWERGEGRIVILEKLDLESKEGTASKDLESEEEEDVELGLRLVKGIKTETIATDGRTRKDEVTRLLASFSDRMVDDVPQHQSPGVTDLERERWGVTYPGIRRLWTGRKTEGFRMYSNF